MVWVCNCGLRYTAFNTKKNWTRYDQKCILVFMEVTRYSRLTLIKLDFIRQIFEKYSHIKFHEKPSIGSRIVPCGWAGRRTDRHYEANSRVSQFCERAWKFSGCLTDVRLQLHILRLTHIWIIYETEAPTSQRTQSIYIRKTDQLMTFNKTSSIFCENYTKLTNTLLGGKWNSFVL